MEVFRDPPEVVRQKPPSVRGLHGTQLVHDAQLSEHQQHAERDGLNPDAAFAFVSRFLFVCFIFIFIYIVASAERGL